MREKEKSEKTGALRAKIFIIGEDNPVTMLV